MTIQVQNQQQLLFPTIVMDERERGDIRKAFLDLNCNVQIETLPVADYVISNEIGIERKRGDDLVASICDNRFFGQLNKLIRQFSKPLIILENPAKMFGRQGVFEASIYGAIIYAVFKLNVAVIPTRNEEETAKAIWAMAKRVQKGLDYSFSYQIPEGYDEGVTKNSQIYFLEGLLNISIKKATQLLEHFETPMGVVDAIVESDVVYTSGGKMKGVSGPIADLKGFGGKFLLQNKPVLTVDFELAKKEKI